MGGPNPDRPESQTDVNNFYEKLICKPENISGCVPAEPYPPLKQRMRLQQLLPVAIGLDDYSGFDRTALSGFDRTTTV
jgi:hypothetical protein